ncbi:ubiquitin-like domain-containing protein [Streptomyces winkii]|uniref:ubiquitin-like domain-containing protein n=1 Tax=Streptomyces winkii TaxID=3051178 RepID=UPI0028D6CC7C|nr:ubiquitin-like domain-containing protein [Streptomyces sp. DSM 40971]
MPEQRYDDQRTLVVPVRPGLPSAYGPPTLYASAPPASAASPYGQRRAHAQAYAQPHAQPQAQPRPAYPARPQGLPYTAGRPAHHPQPRPKQGRHAAPAPAPPRAPAPAPAPPPPPAFRPVPPPRHARNPYDTYRPSYETYEGYRTFEPYEPYERAEQPERSEPGDHADHPDQADQSDEPRQPGRAAARRAARARKAAQRPEALRRLVPQALVVAFLAGGTSAFVAHDKEVELSVDGSPRTLHTFADDVGELLDEEGVELGSHDSVGPSPRQRIADGDEITFSHGRPLDLTLDGTRRRVWTTARTVHDALRRMGVHTQGAALSLAPSADIPATGLRLEVRTERTVTFLADGHEKTVRTNAATVADALAETGVELDGLDTTSAPMDSFPRDGQTITVMRITGREKVKEERIAFKTVRHADPQLPQGTEVVAREGRPGLRRVTYRLRTVNGVREKPRRIAVEVLRKPHKQIIRVGTRPLPQSVPGADHLDWAALAQCESGGRPRAVDASGYHGGLYQFDTPTWQALGGSGRPQDAPAQEQTYRAKKLYVSEGASPWPYCGRKLAE